MSDSVLKIWLGILTAVTAILVVSLTSFFAKNQKKKDYENDYYKKIIDNRVNAYKIIEDLLATLSPKLKHGEFPCFVLFWVTLPYFVQQRNLDLDNQYELSKSYIGIRNRKEDNSYYFKLFMSNLATALRQEVWLSGEIKDELDELFNLFVKIQTEYELTYDTYSKHGIPYKRENLVELGQSYHARVKALYEKIQNTFYLDTISLHKVGNFISTRPTSLKKESIWHIWFTSYTIEIKVFKN